MKIKIEHMKRCGVLGKQYLQLVIVNILENSEGLDSVTLVSTLK